MKLTNVASIRLLNQQIEGGKFNKISSLVSWMGAMQAQDYNMAKWAIGLRVPNSTEDDVQAAIDSGEIIRTHLLRPTWHFVSPGDIHWMLDLSASRIKASMKSRDRELELTSKIYKKANGIFEKSVA